MWESQRRTFSCHKDVHIYSDIYFDTGKADVKPHSLVALDEVVKALKQDANPKVFVASHANSVFGSGGATAER
jgi:outer membrane protein OmpA-like peptidoglycan-associated protein